MKLRTRLNIVIAGLTAAFVIVLIATQIQSTRASVREEIVAANRVASQLLGRLAGIYSREGGPELCCNFSISWAACAPMTSFCVRRPERSFTDPRRRRGRPGAKHRPGLRVCSRRKLPGTRTHYLGACN